MPTLRTVTPMMPAGPRLRDALTFFEEKMGFTITYEGTGTAGIQRDTVAFNLIENDNREWADNHQFQHQC